MRLTKAEKEQILKNREYRKEEGNRLCATAERLMKRQLTKLERKELMKSHGTVQGTSIYTEYMNAFLTHSEKPIHLSFWERVHRVGFWNALNGWESP